MSVTGDRMRDFAQTMDSTKVDITYLDGIWYVAITAVKGTLTLCGRDADADLGNALDAVLDSLEREPR